MDLWGFLSRELWFFLLLGILLGLGIPQIGLHITPYAIYFLLVVMFFTSLSISLGDIFKATKNKRFLLVSLSLIFVISPLVALTMSFFLEAELALGLILYSAIPSAMANAFYIKRMGGDAALALVMTALTTLMAPIVTPIIVKLLSGYFMDINPLDLFFSLFKIIILPFVAAELVRRCNCNLADKILKASPPINNICIFFVVFGVISAAAGQVWSFGILAVIMAFYLAITFFAGYRLGAKNGLEMGFSTGFRNGTLAMVVALEVFGPVAAMIGVMSTLIHNMILVPLLFIKDKK
jgi:bile acid:Na+ symporter, BASS family